MKKILKRGLSFVLALIMLTGLLPVTAFAAVDSSGRPKDVNNTLVLSIYTGTGFPGEPAVYGTSNYKNFNSKFEVKSGATFANSAKDQLEWSKIDKDIVQGKSSGTTSVWGVYDANGTKNYFKTGASIIQPANEAKMIRAIKTELKNKSDDEVLAQYEIIWYVIKLQHSSGWLATTEWHIDGVIKEKQFVSVNYYGNGNTSGDAPLGTTTHPSNTDYTVLGKNTMVKTIKGVEVAFLGWSAKADGTGEEAGFYQPGDVIPAEVLAAHNNKISLYAMWDTTTQYTATVNTYLDGVAASEADIHNDSRDLYLSTDGVHFYALTESSTGVYTANITGNGKFHLYYKDDDGSYIQNGNYQLTIYNQNGSLDVHHYSVTYDPNGGAFEMNPSKNAYNYGDSVTATYKVPTREGYRFLGWENEAGQLIQPGETVVDSIDKAITLTAKWEKTVNVTINVTVNHKGGDGYDQMDTKDDVFMALVSRPDGNSAYLETGDTLQLNKTTHTGFEYSEIDNVTKYTATTYSYTDMPGATTEYTVVTSKSGYETSITNRQDEDGNWIIDVEMNYKPTNFDLDFTVALDQSVPEQYIPDAAIVKVTFWASDRNRWEIITQHGDGKPGVRVDIDRDTLSGSGSYPVWKYESEGTTPYGYRIQVTAFVYPDGTIVPASEVLTQDVAWSDNVYTATVTEVTDGETFGTLGGAYFADGSNAQVGTLHAVITMDLHDVTFDAKGGKVNGQDTQLVEEQYRVPGFKDYVPVREGGYVFSGWYTDEEYKNPATEFVDLTENITLYAKWIEPLTVSGTISISGTYQQDGETVSVHDIDRALEAVVVLQEIRNGTAYDVDSITVDFGDYQKSGSADYSFTGIPNVGKEYRIHVLELNYNTTYDNESDSNSNYTPNEYSAVFGGDNVADVDAFLEFTPPSYDQILKVNAEAIAEAFRPETVLSEVMYRDTGDNHAFQRISQHDVAPYGVNINLTDGFGSDTQSIWKWHTDGTLYEYQMNVTKVDGVDFDSDTAPFYITYAESAYWDGTANRTSGDLEATLIPNQYTVIFNLNAGTDTVTGMEAYEDMQTYVDGELVTNKVTTHTWSFDTQITAEPEREGYIFKGWKISTADNSVTEIDAAVHEDVELIAQWEQITYEVTTAVAPEAGGTVTGAGTYGHGEEVIVEATENAGYTFLGWYENDTLVSKDLKYIFEIDCNHDFEARFSMNSYTVSVNADPVAGGVPSGAGDYGYGTEVTVSTTVNPGYTFLGWKKDNEVVTQELSFAITVTEDVSYTAMFELNKHTVTTTANPAEGGHTDGDGTFSYGTKVTVNAVAETGYTFEGWFEAGKLVCETAEYQFEVTADRTLEAKFARTGYEIFANAEHGGTAEGTATYYYGDNATVKATADKTYSFEGWYEGTEKVCDDLEYTFVVTSDRTLTAKFGKNGYKIITNYTTGGSTTGDGSYDEGDTATVVATPEDGYVFTGWHEGDNLVSNDLSYSFEVTADRTLTATFSKAHTITTIAQTGGSVYGGGKYVPMETATIVAAPNGGYYFAGWYDEQGKLVTAEKEYSLKVKEDRTFTAKFEKKVSYSCDYVYIFGYEDTELGAEGPLLRGELAQMIYRLVKQQTGAGHGNITFTDTSGEWFRTGISYMALKGAINTNKSNVYPNAPVSRGETYKMICLGLGFTSDTNLGFSDYAAILKNSGFISGDGAVTARIKRYEFCALFNAIIGRTNAKLEDASGNRITAETYGYTDLHEGASYYETMLRATSAYTGDYVDLEKRAQRNPLDEYGG